MRAESITLKMAVEMLIKGDDKRSVPIDYYLSRSTLNVFSHINLPTTQISASLNDATLDEALQQIFRQIEAPYVYTIRDSLKLRFSFKFKNLAFPMALYKTTSSVQSPKVCTFDTINDLLILYNSKGYISNPESLPASERYTVRAREADVRWVLKSLFGTAGYNFTLDQWIQGTISIDIRSHTLPEAVESILHKASDSFTYQVENNVYMVSAKVIPQGYRNPKPQVLHK